MTDKPGKYTPDQPIVRGADVIYRPPCACGCGETVGLTREGRVNTFIHGHSRRGVSPSPDHRRKLSIARIGQPGPWRGKTIPAPARLKMSAAKKGRPLTPEHRSNIAAAQRGKPHPSIHHPQTPETRLKKSMAQRGHLGSNWQGGKSAENDRARASAQYAEWRGSIFRRDGFRCRCCGAKKPLHAHHIKPFATFPELRFEVDNGVTFCQTCHDVVHHRVELPPGHPDPRDLQPFLPPGYDNPLRVEQHH